MDQPAADAREYELSWEAVDCDACRKGAGDVQQREAVRDEQAVLLGIEAEIEIHELARGASGLAARVKCDEKTPEGCARPLIGHEEQHERRESTTCERVMPLFSSAFFLRRIEWQLWRCRAQYGVEARRTPCNGVVLITGGGRETGERGQECGDAAERGQRHQRGDACDEIVQSRASALDPKRTATPL